MADHGGLSRDSLIVVVVCAAFAALVLAYILFACLRRTAAAPLPPVQPLAHYREQRPSPSLFKPAPFTDDAPLPLPSFPSSSSFLSTDTSHQSHRRPRPLSTSSFNSAATPVSSRRSTFRGVPHAPNNQVQLVLPTPLAPSLRRRASLSGDLTHPDKLSAVDMWVPVGRDYLRTSPSGFPSHTPSRRVSSPPSSSPPSFPYQPPPFPQHHQTETPDSA